MAIKQVILTKEGLKSLEDELEFLKTTRRQEVAEKIKVALSFGDLSENSEYDEAKNEQAIMESRIAEITATLKNARVIDSDDISNEHIHIGSKVQLEITTPQGSKLNKEYRIVGSNEADPSEGKISDESAVGKALLDHKPGDTVQVEVPAGLMTYTIISISK